jgi:DNA-binding transcriptional regulator LsrR (DeoR family)
MRPKSDDLLVVAAAYLHGQQKTQEAIAASLGVSQPLVSRLIARARQDGILRTATTFVEDRVDPKELERAKAKIRRGPLQEVLTKIGDGAVEPPVLHIFPSHSRTTSRLTWQFRIEEFCDDCAADLLEVIESSSVIGVAWGRTIAKAIGAMDQKKRPSEGRAPAQAKKTVIPLLGEPLGRSAHEYSSSVLAYRLAEALDPNTQLSEILSLAPVPAMIPADMTKGEVRAIRKLIGKITAYRQIYGTDQEESKGKDQREPWIDRVDAILTSISPQERPLGFDDDLLIRAAEIDRGRFNNLILGDLCGVVIPRSNLDNVAKAEVENIMARWTGVKMGHLQDCARRALNRTPDRAPGVIVLAIGANKATVVYEALRKGLIQHLFTDEDLADRLEQICSKSGPGRHYGKS